LLKQVVSQHSFLVLVRPKLKLQCAKKA
jgi:hypothetical protein